MSTSFREDDIVPSRVTSMNSDDNNNSKGKSTGTSMARERKALRNTSSTCGSHFEPECVVFTVRIEVTLNSISSNTTAAGAFAVGVVATSTTSTLTTSSTQGRVRDQSNSQPRNTLPSAHTVYDPSDIPDTTTSSPILPLLPTTTTLYPPPVVGVA
ncbi:hypothetical protein BDN72DRAFT_896160 [Pluteus cervinus]|uniref:Uncharacterized protein n=1 Tax=Pluteus cervinus TaxID=181527 RepID=A0ACD3AZM6_9AGAR|nr:hypothetical protein BDN72DRAFT_896160 [Pluteus cervinus]